MKLAKLPPDPTVLIDFFQEGLEASGAICERSWHDRLHLVAEGPAARLWNPTGELIETEIHFPAPDQSAPRDAGREVFPGCPLTFHLAETLRPACLQLQRGILQSPENVKPPALDVAEKLWHAQRPGSNRWKQEAPFKPDWHFSLLVLVRCEIQAIDQHWSLHRVIISLPDGRRDESLANTIDFCALASHSEEPVPWPTPSLEAWHNLLHAALKEELEMDVEAIRRRQENYLRRELERIDSYFESYERELAGRRQRQHNEAAKIKTEERLAAARDEHTRRRRDQVLRHEIRIIPHQDALMLLAEPAWKTQITATVRNESRTREALFVPRARRWIAG
jgi:hypothetical protein